MNTIRRLGRVEHVLLFLLCIVSIFAYSNNMNDTYVVPKWCYTILFFVLILIVWSVKKLFNQVFHFDILAISYIIIVACTFQVMYGIAQWLQLVSFDGNYGITGSFDNPAGFAINICIAFPFILLCKKSAMSNLGVFVMVLLTLFFVFAIVISESRAGMISMLAIVCIELYRHFPVKTKSKAIAIFCMFLLFLSGSYFLKKDSADGRLFIWKCVWEMIVDSPVYGHGIGCFRVHYMDYQADYLEQHPDCEYAMLADNVISPFNEYLSVILNFGTLGMLVLIFLILFLISCYYRNCECEKRIALLSLLGIAVFSMFSYPLTYPFVWVIICVDVYLILRGCFPLAIFSIFIKKTLCVMAIVGGIVVSYKLYVRMNAEYRWNDIAYFSTNENLSVYTELMPILGDNPYFLYNYAVALFDKCNLEASLNIALQCRSYWSDYDLELLLGDIYTSKNDYNKAENHYKKASFMCPSRFTPLYQLFFLYKKMGDIKKAKAMAQLIYIKPVKVQSERIKAMKNQVGREIGLQ